MTDNNRHGRSLCPIACTLDIIGDKWTLIVIRDLFTGKKRYKEFTDSPEKIPTNILAERLKRLETYELVEKRARNPNSRWVEYFLTPKGEALLPVLQEICKWGNMHIEKTWLPPEWFMEKKVQDD
ncbi:winged helix-turn-helix transcriptional regulator [Pseudomonadota bacterium]